LASLELRLSPLAKAAVFVAMAGVAVAVYGGMKGMSGLEIAGKTAMGLAALVYLYERVRVSRAARKARRQG
jgi:uncharacterized protein YraI